VIIHGRPCQIAPRPPRLPGGTTCGGTTIGDAEQAAAWGSPRSSGARIPRRLWSSRVPGFDKSVWPCYGEYAPTVADRGCLRLCLSALGGSRRVRSTRPRGVRGRPRAYRDCRRMRRYPGSSRRPRGSSPTPPSRAGTAVASSNCRWPIGGTRPWARRWRRAGLSCRVEPPTARFCGISWYARGDRRTFDLPVVDTIASGPADTHDTAVARSSRTHGGAASGIVNQRRTGWSADTPTPQGCGVLGSTPPPVRSAPRRRCPRLCTPRRRYGLHHSRQARNVLPAARLCGGTPYVPSVKVRLGRDMPAKRSRSPEARPVPSIPPFPSADTRNGNVVRLHPRATAPGLSADLSGKGQGQADTRGGRASG